LTFQPLPGIPPLGAGVLSDGRPRLYVADSPVHGQGVFTNEAYRQGVLVATCVGLVRRRDELLPDARVMQIGVDAFLLADPEHPSIDDFLNHSCEPNLGFMDGSLNLFALRGIAAGSELLYDYSTTMNQHGWSVRCRCRSKTCRGNITSFCDLSPSEKERLEPISLAYLREGRTPTP
jgi:SET domain-containing protein